MTLRLTSPAFVDDGEIPVRFTCDGEDVSPPLAWSGAPTATQSFVLICRDPDAPRGTWYHWGVFDIPATLEGLAEHCRPQASGLMQALNDFGQQGYGGPCPPPGHGRHHYHFLLHALDTAHLGQPAKAGCRAVEQAARTHTLATAELIGRYGS